MRLSTQNQVLSLDSLAATLKLGKMSALQDKNLELEIINPDGRQLIRQTPILRKILHGLINNAIEASILKTIELSLRLSLETGMLIIEVTDYGEGLTQTNNKPCSVQVKSFQELAISPIFERLLSHPPAEWQNLLRSKKGLLATLRVQLPVQSLINLFLYRL